MVCFYAPGRGGEHAETFLTGFDGVLQLPSRRLQAIACRATDGYPGYSRLTRPSRKGGAPVTVAHCWAHARRKLREIFDRD
ncbi:transposase, partial [Poseidonocella sp. HB161398]|uniref:IS66 family transposase n=1 Tax=Poseidonocella sp. HB161398 TaxID=2320855 RepID=UPI0035128235